MSRASSPARAGEKNAGLLAASSSSLTPDSSSAIPRGPASALLLLLGLVGAGLLFAYAGPLGVLLAFVLIVIGSFIAIFVILGRDG